MVNQSLQELLDKIENFKKTISELSSNVEKFREKIMDNVKKYGEDPNKWPNS